MSCPAARPAPSAVTNLETGMAYRLALIIGPQGNGKTALLRQWAAWRSSSAQSHPCWANLTEEDNRLAHFLTHLAWALAGLDAQPDGLMRAASRVSGPGMNSGAKAALHPLQAFGGQYEAESFLIGLINSLSEVRGDIALILDEYHLIRAPEIHRAVDFLLEYLPPGLHLYLAARREPPLRLAHLRARRQMIQMGPAELFDKEPSGL